MAITQSLGLQTRLILLVAAGGTFLISVIICMKNLEINGIKVRVTKYKVTIYDEDDKI